MTDKLITLLTPSISQLSFIHRYGGLAKIVTRKISGEDLMVNFMQESFPVSSNVTERECFEQGKYLMLCPDDRYYSVSWFEDVSGMQFSGFRNDKSHRHNYPKFQGQVRFVIWLNYPKLGLDSTENSTDVAMALMGAMNKEFFNLTDPYNYGHVKFTVNTVEPQSRDPFDKYNFSEITGLKMYPYGYLSMILDINVTMTGNCYNDLNLSPEIDCVEL